MHELCAEAVSSQGQGKTNPDFFGAASISLWCSAALISTVCLWNLVSCKEVSGQLTLRINNEVASGHF